MTIPGTARVKLKHVNSQQKQQKLYLWPTALQATDKERVYVVVKKCGAEEQVKAFVLKR